MRSCDLADILGQCLKINCGLMECGNLVRLGSQFDGGYVVCRKDLLQSNFLLSFGINDDWNFESSFLKVIPDAVVHSYDYSVRFYTYVMKLVGAIPRLVLRRISFAEFLRRISLPFHYLSFFRGKSVHFQEKVTSPIFAEFDVSVPIIFSRVDSDFIYLKIDIEGSEYKILREILEFSDRIVGMVIEFHDVTFLQDKFQLTLNQLSQHFDIIHIHGNNFNYISKDTGVSDVLELTLSKRGNHSKEVKILSTPVVGLDSPNDRTKPDHVFSIKN